MLSHSVPIDDNASLTVSALKTGATGLSLTLVEDGVGRASVYLADQKTAHQLIAALIDASRHMDWLSERQANSMVMVMRRQRGPRWLRWLTG